jgi:hypothetical protein
MVKQGYIIWLDFDPHIGHEQKRRRPALVIEVVPKTEVLEQLYYWTCSITRLVISQVSQNAPHFAVFKRKLFKN